MPLMSCITTEKNNIVVPSITFPLFPELQEYEKMDNCVLVSNEWIIQLAEYKILIEETEKNYNEIKELYENECK